MCVVSVDNPIWHRTLSSVCYQSDHDESVGKHLSDHGEMVKRLVSYILAGAESYIGKCHGTQWERNTQGISQIIQQNDLL